MPAELAGLFDLALDLRWTWSHGGDALWRALDAGAWDLTRNPWFILQSVPERRLEALARDAGFREELGRLLDDRASHLNAPPSRSLDGLIAYFSMEYGLGSAVPLYAGGLGILAGDHLKTACDLGVPMVAVGLLYQEGYFRQTIDADGRQHETYPYNDPSTLPIEPALASDGAWVRVSLDLPGRPLWLRVWHARVGRIALLLLDGNDPNNDPVDRGITAKLYGGDAETRLLQEIVLGIGGPRALEALDMAPEVVHLNEGHSAFVALDRARQLAAREQVSLGEALWASRAGNVFTMHTPVSAGLDVFPATLIEKYFPSNAEYLGAIGSSTEELLALGRKNASDDRETFSMVHLAIRGSARVNGVSRVHAEVSRRLFTNLFPRWAEREVPISHVTNGVHARSWDSAAADELWTRACGKERWMGAIDRLSEAVARVSDENLWAFKSAERHELVRYARERLRMHHARRGNPALAERASQALDPNVLTLGFARRFVEYKRPNLLLADPDRLARLLCSPERPLQLVIAGKAHPADEGGKRMISEWMAFFARPEIRDRALFIEDHDMAGAEEMVRGVDLWLNTPRKPWEACGTSGMKVLVNGGLNVSVLDGWWAEGWSPDVGWAFGDGPSRSDADDAEALYCLLEQQIVPEFYARDAAGIPRAWVARIRSSVSRLTPLFSSNRMVLEYMERFYAPSMDAYRRRTKGNAALAKELFAWSERVKAHWHQIHFGSVDIVTADEGLGFRAAIYLGEIEPSDVAVELYAERDGRHPAVSLEMTRDGALSGAANGHLYEARIVTERPGSDFTVRVVPHHAEALVPAELSLIAWQR